MNRRVLEGMAPAMIEIVADLVGAPDPGELMGYVVVALRKDGGFGIASNAVDDASEAVILRDILGQLETAHDS